MTNYDNFEHGYKGIMDVRLTDLYPIDSTEIRCLSYVDEVLTAEFQKYTERIVLASNVENLPEPILDYLAIQYRIPYYDSAFDIDKKRALVKEGYQWSMTAGTTDCIRRLTNAIFGNGKVIEWYEDGTMQEGEFDIEINEKDMTEEITRVKTGQITYAVRDTHIDDKEIHEGDIMGIGDHGMLAVGKEVAAVAKETVEQMVDDETELISIYYGEGFTEEEAEKLAGELEEQYDYCDVEVNCGGQPIYYCIISVE